MPIDIIGRGKPDSSLDKAYIASSEDANQMREEMRMKLTKEQEKALKQDFADEALSVDSSRGFPLTSIKAMYVIERLNEVFGVFGWGYEFTAPVDLNGEFVSKVTLTIYDEEHRPYHTVSQYGGKRPVKNRITDTYKSAITDGLTKCASILGIGHSVFKGNSALVHEREDTPAPRFKPAPKPASSPPLAGDMTEILHFGKYKGMSLAQIHAENSSYLPWLIKSDMMKKKEYSDLKGQIGLFLDNEEIKQNEFPPNNPAWPEEE